jgi:hypothetical protein
MHVDWYLALQHNSCVVRQASVLFEHVPVPRGEWQLDVDAASEPSLNDSISWLIAMLFIAIKFIVRGGDAAFLRCLGEAYHEVQARFGLRSLAITEPTSLGAVSDILRQLAPYADDAQCRALLAANAFDQELHE